MCIIVFVRLDISVHQSYLNAHGQVPLKESVYCTKADTKVIANDIRLIHILRNMRFRALQCPFNFLLKYLVYNVSESK